VDVNDATFGGTDPCPDTGKYLEVIYLCVPGKTPLSTYYCFSGRFPGEVDLVAIVGVTLYQAIYP